MKKLIALVLVLSLGTPVVFVGEAHAMMEWYHAMRYYYCQQQASQCTTQPAEEEEVCDGNCCCGGCRCN